MAYAKHSKTATIPDNPDYEINSTEWNANQPVTLEAGENYLTDAEQSKLAGIQPGATAAGAIGDAHAGTLHAPADAEKNVQPDWNQADTGADDFIKNKPDIPAAYTLPVASASILGGVKQGTNISIDENGVISATAGGSVDSVNGQTGTVMLDAADVGALETQIITDADLYPINNPPAGWTYTEVADFASMPAGDPKTIVKTLDTGFLYMYRFRSDIGWWPIIEFANQENRLVVFVDSASKSNLQFSTSSTQLTIIFAGDFTQSFLITGTSVCGFIFVAGDTRYVPPGESTLLQAQYDYWSCQYINDLTAAVKVKILESRLDVHLWPYHPDLILGGGIPEAGPETYPIGYLLKREEYNWVKASSLSTNTPITYTSADSPVTLLPDTPYLFDCTTGDIVIAAFANAVNGARYYVRQIADDNLNIYTTVGVMVNDLNTGTNIDITTSDGMFINAAIKNCELEFLIYGSPWLIKNTACVGQAVNSYANSALATIYEKALGNPLDDEEVHILSSLADGTRSWIAMEAGIPDAPSDGKIYVRRNGAWEELVIG